MKNMHRLIYLMLLLSFSVRGQKISYGTNDSAGRYLDVGNASLYYEVYGDGSPILLLHGGMFGYIDEFSQYIKVLSQDHQVIAVATRGHGRSELGSSPLSYELFAQDAQKILKKESNEPAIIIGFSDGAITSYIFGARYPEITKKIVALAGGFGSTWFHKEALDHLKKLTPKSLSNDYPDFVRARKKLMPHPEQWDQFIVKLNEVNQQEEFISDELAKTITCPVLLLGGDRDDYFRLDNFVHVYQTLSNAQLGIVPNCTHIGLVMNQQVLHDFVLPFLED